MARNRFLSNIAGFVGDIGRARSAAATYQQLSGLSDAELTRRGLTRESLASHVFNDSFGR